MIILSFSDLLQSLFVFFILQKFIYFSNLISLYLLKKVPRRQFIKKLATEKILVKAKIKVTNKFKHYNRVKYKQCNSTKGRHLQTKNCGRSVITELPYFFVFWWGHEFC